jgi:hypothetical protein
VNELQMRQCSVSNDIENTTLYSAAMSGSVVDRGIRDAVAPTRADQNLFINCHVRFQSNRLTNFFPREWHRGHQIVYVKVDLLEVAGRVSGAVRI